MIELCAGCGQLSASFRDLGYQILPFDHSHNRHHTRVTVYELDLTGPDAYNILHDIILNCNVVYIHAAPPCGTASRARNRPISAELRMQGAPQPPPLRSSAFPLGLPNLSTINRTKVDAANAIYELVVKIVRLCIARNLPFSVENPDSSFFWELPFWSNVSECGFEDVVFSGCMHGGDRDRLCKWRASKNLLNELSVRCDGKHQHKPWSMSKVAGKWNFATAEEAEYPKVLTDKVALLVSMKQRVQLPFNRSLNSDIQGHQAAAIKAHKQPRGNKIPNVVSEYKEVVEVPSIELGHSKLLRNIPDGEDKRNHVIAGVYRTPVEYIEEAKQILHPIDHVDAVHPILREAVDQIVSEGPVATCRFRCLQLRKYEQWGKELEAQEEALHGSLDKSVAKILQGKKLLLFKRILEDTAYADGESLFNEICGGFNIVGKTTSSGCLRPRIVPASISVKELRKSSRWNRKAVIAACKSSGDVAIDKLVMADTLEEVDKGWLRGPFCEEQVTEELGTDEWLCVERFPLLQKDKVRLIDNCKVPRINNALVTTEKLDLMGIDHISNLALLLSERMSDKARNPEWDRMPKDLLEVVGRTLDLKAAYKNLACSPDTRWASVLVVWSWELQSVSFFISDALMFGSTAAVYAFNRCARAIWHCAVKGLRLLTCQFYDDFPSIELKALSAGAHTSFEVLLQLIGWKVSASDRKRQPFAPSFRALGVQIDTSNLSSGRLLISNTEERILEISTEIAKVILQGRLAPPQAAQLFGRLSFALSAVFGRGAAPGLRLISEAASSNAVGSLNSEELGTLEELKVFIEQSEPRTISTSDNKRPILVFTDGAVEPGSVTYGIVLIDGDECFVAGGDIPDSIVSEWKATVGDQVIGQAELFPVALAKAAWSNRMKNRRVIYFVDNDAARFGMIKMSSPSMCSRHLIRLFYTLESLCPSMTWFARVPSKSNPADQPSRNEVELAANSLGGSIIKLDEFAIQIADRLRCMIKKRSVNNV